MEEFLQQLAQSAQPTDGIQAPIASEILALLISALLGTVLAFVYNATYTGKKDERMQISFTIILLCVGGALVWLLVADKLVRAFGLAGALSLIRYRTNMNDPKDNSMVLFAILFGMACGVHQYYTAAVGVVVLSALLIIMKAVNNKVRAGMPLVTGNGNGSGTAPAAGEGAAETKGGERPSALEDEDGVFESRAETDD